MISYVFFMTTQGESNLQFMWFVLKQAGVTVPSLAHVKKFVLPDFTSPKRVCTLHLIDYIVE